MRCDECLPLLDEYVCGELSGPTAARVSAHLTACETCAGERASLTRERSFYERCAVSAPPSLWASVSRRIEEEETPRAHEGAAVPRARPWYIFGEWLPRPRVAFGAAAVAVALAVITSWALFRAGRHPAVVQSQDRVAVTGGAPVAEAPHTDGARAPDRPRQDTARETQPLVVAGRVETGGGTGGAPPRVAAVRRASRRSAPPGARRDTSPTTSVTSGPGTEETTARPRAAVAEVIYDETARHIGRAQMLLRSLKNGQPSEGGAGFDLAYERRFSRELLGRNILLRREAQSDGDEATARLLGQLEPFLLDIANLDEMAASAQVRSISERVRREGIIARLRLF